jgi:hypothetical protein
MTERKDSRVSVATKASQNSVSKTPKLRSKKANGSKRKIVRPPTDFRSMAWYAVAAQSIAIVATVES